MHFDSLTFALAFSALWVAMRLLRPEVRRRNLVLLLVSYGFYATWSLLYLPFLVGSTLIDYWVARRLARAENYRRGWLCLSLAVNLSLLGWFKYAEFAAGLLSSVSPELASAMATEHWGTSFVPLGISFFTFQTLSYSVDVYRRDIEPTDSLVDFALYVSFFPQLVAGPIVLAREMLPQLERPSVHTTRERAVGMELIILGLFQKVVLADALFRPVVQRVFDDAGLVTSSWDHWLGVYAFWGQLYCDFSGYSNVAIGMAACLGFRLPANFNCPFAARSFAEFWRRWHMTLTRWFGTYLYRPLGGRKCHPIQSAANVAIVMVVAGLWHGAAWTFALWGMLHAILLVGERVAGAWLARRRGTRAPLISGWPRAGLVCLAVGHTCVLFRAHDLDQARHILAAMYGSMAIESASVLPSSRVALVLLALAGLFAIQWHMRDRNVISMLNSRPLWQSALCLTAMMLCIFVCIHAPEGYLYFQF